jgi:hypothetical protein
LHRQQIAMKKKVIANRYELIKPIGTGGMAEVYLARDRKLDRTVAIKLLHADNSGDPAFHERFRREARAAASLDHPNVVPVYDWGIAGGAQYIVMEHVGGGNLKQAVISRGPFPEPQALAICAKVASALDAAHRSGLIHRDLKPQNVLLDQDGNPKLTDFGIARAVGETQLTRTSAVIGTAHYMSPEQAQGQPIDGRSDLYSLGIVLYELLTGKVPFDADTPLAIALQHLNATPPRPRRMLPRISGPTEEVVVRALAKRPARRYQSADEMRRALERAAERLAPRRRAAFIPGRTMVVAPVLAAGGPPRRRIAPALVAVLLLLGLGTLALAVPTFRPGPATSPENVSLASPTPQTTASAATASPTQAPTPAPTSAPTAAPAPAPAVQPQPTPAPLLARVPSTGSPAAAVQTFYSLITQKKLDDALALWSQRMRANFPPNENLYGRFGPTHRISADRINVVSVNDQTGVAVVEVEVVEVYGSPAVTRRWVGTWQLVRTADGWLLDQPNLRAA